MAAGADPGRVIDRMANQIGDQAKQLAIAQDMIQSLEEENARLKANQQEE